jgi:hypothetical protein
VRTLILLVMAGAFGWVAVMMDVGLVGAYFTQLRALGFASTEGVVTQSGVREDVRGQSTFFSVDVSYRYDVDGRSYEASALRAPTFETVPDRAQAEQMARTWPEGAPVTVRYDSRHPETAVLQPGLNGMDLFSLMFVLVLNMAALLLLYFLIAETVGFPRRMILNGGVKSFEVGRQLHVRLDRFHPVMSGVIMFFLALLVGMLASQITMDPTKGVALIQMLLVWAGVLGVTSAVVARQLWKQNKGMGDLVIDPDQAIIEIPLINMPGRRITVPLADVREIKMETIVHRGSRGSRTWIDQVSLHRRNGDSVMIMELGDAERAEVFATWLRRKLEEMGAPK